MGDTLVHTVDYVVVGAGSAGCVLAARLSEEPDVQVALLEAGPPDTNPLIHCPAGFALGPRLGFANWSFETEPQPGLNGRRGYQPRGKVLGGSGSINAMIYTRGHPADYDGWARAGNPGWSWHDVLPYFRKAEANSRGADVHHGADGPLHVMDPLAPHRFSRYFVQAAEQAGYLANPDFNAADPEGVGLFQLTQKAGQRFSAARAYLEPNRSRANLQVMTDAHATRILFEGRRAVGIAYRQGGQDKVVRARREVILSAGALLSPQLLQLSGIGDAAQLQSVGIPVLHDLPGVGQHLHDHPDVVLAYDTPGITDLIGLSARGVWNLLRAVREWQRHRTGTLTTNFAEAGGFIRSAPGEALPDLGLHFVIGKLVDHGRKTLFGHGYSCHVCVLRPRSRGSLTLRSADPLAAPRIDPNFLSDPDDLERLVRGVRAMRDILAQPAMAQWGGSELPRSVHATTDTQIAEFVRANADTIYHPVGSCRMGNGPLDVVDAQLRVHGLEGLRVVDASVMPDIIGGNTNAPVIMIAEKAADLVKQSARAHSAALHLSAETVPA